MDTNSATPRSIGNRLVALAVVVISAPLVLGGLIAAGEAHDWRVLALGVSLLILAPILVGSRRSMDRDRVRATPDNGYPSRS